MSEQVLGQLGVALGIGATYALLAVGYSVAYSTLNVVNLAHGEVFMGGALAAYFVLTAITPESAAGAAAAFGVALLVAVAVSSLLAVALERMVYRRIAGSGRLSLILAALGASLALQQIALLVLRTFGSGSSERRMPLGPLEGWEALGLAVPQLAGLAILLIGGALLYWIIEKTDFGLCMRTVAHDRDVAARARLPHAQITTRAFALGGALAGAAGVVYASYYTFTPFMGWAPGMKAFLACVVGGRTIPGALAGGFVIGAVEGLVSGLLGAGTREIVMSGLLIGLLALRPSGMLGPLRARTL